MKRFFTFGLLPVVLFFAGCPDIEDHQNFLADNVTPLVRPLAPVIDYHLLDGVEFEELEFLNYKMFGAGGEGLTDDLDTIIRTHDVANAWNKKVKVSDGTYYIGGEDRNVIIQTSTDWTGATIIIDDRDAQNLFKHVFRVISKLPTRQISSIRKLSIGDTKLDVQLEYPSFVTINDDTLMTYRRYGTNSHGGVPQNDIVVVDRQGNIRDDTPIIFDFNYISSMTAYPIDEETLYITGGEFGTHGYLGELYLFAGRGIHITRSNVVVSNVHHRLLSSQGSTSAPPCPYRGFIVVELCTDVLVQDTILHGRPNGNTNVGTYDVSVLYASNVYFKNCSQFDSHTQGSNVSWGIFSSNNTKNLTFDNVRWSRFDAHRGVFNVNVINSDIGAHGNRALGEGVLRVMNTTIRSGSIIQMRDDYGSSWKGDIIIQDVTHTGTGNLIALGTPQPQFFWGQPLYWAENIWIDGITFTSSVNTARNLTNTNGGFGTAGPGAFQTRTRFIYTNRSRGSSTTINMQNVNNTSSPTNGATVIPHTDTTNYRKPPIYEPPAVKYLPSGPNGYNGDYQDWTSFPDPDPLLYPDWGKERP
ncbi:MAG: hypothetical protein FWG89_10325 [Treponema sp.]|nr:hypothetical protein [Treponema sp.]